MNIAEPWYTPLQASLTQSRKFSLSAQNLKKLKGFGPKFGLSPEVIME